MERRGFLKAVGLALLALAGVKPADAWRPWRSIVMQQGPDVVVAEGFYRVGVPGPVVQHWVVHRGGAIIDVYRLGRSPGPVVKK